MTSGGKHRNKAGKSPSRSWRLAMELRENLRKRKAQERARIASSGAGEQSKADSATRDERGR